MCTVVYVFEREGKSRGVFSREKTLEDDVACDE